MMTGSEQEMSLEEARAATLACMHLKMAALFDRIQVFWCDIEPTAQAWIAECRQLTGEQWMAEPESTRERYLILTLLLEKLRPSARM